MTFGTEKYLNICYFNHNFVIRPKQNSIRFKKNVLSTFILDFDVCTLFINFTN